MFVDIRDPKSQRLLCRYDPDRTLLEFRHGSKVTLIDLTAYDGNESQGAHMHHNNQEPTPELS